MQGPRTSCRVGGSVHSTAIVADTARIGEDVEIGPYAVVGEGVVVGRGSVLREHCVLRRGTVVGEGTTIDSFSVLGGDPQDTSFDTTTTSGVSIGDRVAIRESVTVHRSTRKGGVTRIGDGAMLMAGSHVAHDGQVGQDAVLANNVMLGGHVEVGEKAFLGGGAGIHQYVRIGEGAMIGGNAAISYDVPPFTLAVGRNQIHGLNLVGLRRRQLPVLVIRDIKRCYRAVFATSGDVRTSAAALLRSGECGDTELGRRLLEFFSAGVRGFARPVGRG